MVRAGCNPLCFVGREHFENELHTTSIRPVHNKGRRILPKVAMRKALGFRLVPERIKSALHTVPKIFETL